MKHKPTRIHVSNDRLRSLSCRVRRMRLHNENNYMIDQIMTLVSDASFDAPFGSILQLILEFGIFGFVHDLRIGRSK